ncbi:MAG TPA: hypothetical protein VK668_20160 [Mucilaginibacter sp.]|nr:hypothetical protein [Mucilaginibacter sp.]
MITDIEQETSDIEWFFICGEEIGFVESGGGKLPNSISIKSMEEIILLATYFRNLPAKSDVVINRDLKRLLTPGTAIKEYLTYFVELAEKGIYSFDKTVSNRFADTNYHLVAKPTNPLKVSELPLEITNLIAETKIIGNIGMSLDISQIG